MGRSFCSSKLNVYALLRRPIMEEQINDTIKGFDYEAILEQPVHLIIYNWMEKYMRAKHLSMVIIKHSFTFGENPYEFSLNELLFFLKHFCHFWFFLKKRNDFIPLKICIEEMYFRIKGYYSCIEREIDNLPSYSNHVMAAFQTKIGNPAPLILFKERFFFEWLQKKGDANLPNLQQLLILKLIQKKILNYKFLYTLRETYSLGYRDAARDSCHNFINCRFEARKVPKTVQENMELFSPIPICWLKFWLLSMRLELDALEREREITKIGGTLFEKLMYALQYATKRLPELQKLYISNIRYIEYELEYSCLLVDYLISIVNFAIHFDLMTSEQALLFSLELKSHSVTASKIIYITKSLIPTKKLLK